MVPPDVMGKIRVINTRAEVIREFDISSTPSAFDFSKPSNVPVPHGFALKTGISAFSTGTTFYFKGMFGQLDALAPDQPFCLSSSDISLRESQGPSSVVLALSQAAFFLDGQYVGKKQSGVKVTIGHSEDGVSGLKVENLQTTIDPNPVSILALWSPPRIVKKEIPKQEIPKKEKVVPPAQPTKKEEEKVVSKPPTPTPPWLPIKPKEWKGLCSWDAMIQPGAKVVSSSYSALVGLTFAKVSTSVWLDDRGGSENQKTQLVIRGTNVKEKSNFILNVRDANYLFDSIAFRSASPEKPLCYSATLPTNQRDTVWWTKKGREFPKDYRIEMKFRKMPQVWGTVTTPSTPVHVWFSTDGREAAWKIDGMELYDDPDKIKDVLKDAPGSPIHITVEGRTNFIYHPKKR